MSNNEVITQALKFIKNKGNNYPTIYRAVTRLASVRHLITTDEFQSVSVALSHKSLGEGAAELNGIINTLLIKYR